MFDFLKIYTFTSSIMNPIPISQTLTKYSKTPIFEKIERFNETQPPERQVSYEILCEKDLFKCILTGDEIRPLGNSKDFELMEENGFVFFVKDEFAEMIREKGLKEVQKEFSVN